MISVLMCTYNREKYLRKAIDSVLHQTYDNFEFIIVDDGSTDGTETLIKSYEDSRIHYIKMEKNAFYCYAANQGLRHCKGKYVAFMNSDDEWLPEKLEKQLQFLEKNPQYGACFTAVALMDNDGNNVTDECPYMRDLFAQQYNSQKECLRRLVLKGNTLCHPSALIKKELLARVGGFNLLYCQLADYDLWMRLVLEEPIYVLSERMMRFRWDTKEKNQISSNSQEHNVRSDNEQVLICENLFDQMSDGQFAYFFREDFQNPKSSTHIEMEFEKCFLLIKSEGWSRTRKAAGMRKIERVLREPEAFDVLYDHFNLSIFDVYDWHKEHIYIREEDFKFWQDTLSKQQKAQEEERERLLNIINEYDKSTSWKITAPFRKIMEKVRRHG